MRFLSLFVIASLAKQSRAEESSFQRDCFVATLLAMTHTKSEELHARQYPRDPDRDRNQRARRAGGAGAGDPASARAESRRSADPDRRGRDQPRRYVAAHGPLSDAGGGERHSRPRMRGHGGQNRRGGERLG